MGISIWTEWHSQRGCKEPSLVGSFTAMFKCLSPLEFFWMWEQNEGKLFCFPCPEGGLHTAAKFLQNVVLCPLSGYAIVWTEGFRDGQNSSKTLVGSGPVCLYKLRRRNSIRWREMQGFTAFFNIGCVVKDGSRLFPVGWYQRICSTWQARQKYKVCRALFAGT